MMIDDDRIREVGGVRSLFQNLIFKFWEILKVSKGGLPPSSLYLLISAFLHGKDRQDLSTYPLYELAGICCHILWSHHCLTKSIAVQLGICNHDEEENIVLYG